MANNIASVVLALPPFGLLSIGWWSWGRNLDHPVQIKKWRSAALMVALVSLSANVLISFGYLMYASLSQSAKFSVFDNCSSAGAVACAIGLVASAIGKGSSKLWVVLGSVAGVLTWYLTIGPSS